MKEYIDIFLKMIGLTVVTTAMLITIQRIIDAVTCEHKYTVTGMLTQGERNIIYLRCSKCGKKKTIEIYNDDFVVELKDNANMDGDEQ